MIQEIMSEKMWMEAIIVCFKVVSQPLPGQTEVKHENLRTTILQAESCTQELLNMKQESIIQYLSNN
jgi:hypothetical protein